MHLQHAFASVCLNRTVNCTERNNANKANTRKSEKKGNAGDGNNDELVEVKRNSSYGVLLVMKI